MNNAPFDEVLDMLDDYAVMEHYADGWMVGDIVPGCGHSAIPMRMYELAYVLPDTNTIIGGGTVWHSLS